MVCLESALAAGFIVEARSILGRLPQQPTRLFRGQKKVKIDGFLLFFTDEKLSKHSGGELVFAVTAMG